MSLQPSDNNSNNNSKTKPVSTSSYKVPRDIGKGLLKFCLTHTDSPNLVENSSIPERDPKDYEWLRAAFDNLEDDAKRMKKMIEIIQDKQSSSEQIITTLERLQFFIEDLDNAGDFIKIGGLPVLVELIKSTNKEIRQSAAGSLSILSQNEDSIQNHLISIGLLELTINLLSKETEPICREKYLSLISSLFSYDMKKISENLLESVVKLSASFLSPTVDLILTSSNNDVDQQEEKSYSIINSIQGMSKACFILKKIFIAFPNMLKLSIDFDIVESCKELLTIFNNLELKQSIHFIMAEKVEQLLQELIKDKPENNENRKLIKEMKDSFKSELEKRLKFLKSLHDNVDDEISIIVNLLVTLNKL